MERPRQLIRDQQMLLVVGAGLSARVGYPTFNAYARTLVDDFGVTVEDIVSDDASATAAAVKASLDADGRLSEFHAHLGRTFGPNGRRRVLRPRASSARRRRLPGIVTTNYEPWLRAPHRERDCHWWGGGHGVYPNGFVEAAEDIIDGLWWRPDHGWAGYQYWGNTALREPECDGDWWATFDGYVGFVYQHYSFH